MGSAEICELMSLLGRADVGVGEEGGPRQGRAGQGRGDVKQR